VKKVWSSVVASLGRAVAATRKGVRLAYPVAAQWVGFGTAIGGVFLLIGLAWTLVIGGLSLFALGVLAEGGKL
jgi:hypothetical protein